MRTHSPVVADLGWSTRTDMLKSTGRSVLVVRIHGLGYQSIEVRVLIDVRLIMSKIDVVSEIATDLNSS